MSAVEVPIEALGEPIKGPTALGSDPRRFWHLTRALAVTEFKLRFFGSALGYLWQLMRPLMLFGVMYVVFSLVIRLGTGVKFYPAALLLGVVLFTFFSEATAGGVTSLLDRENLVRKIEFPRLAVPLATVLTAAFNLSLNLLAVLVFLLASGGQVRASWLELPLLVLALAAVSSGLAMALSALYVRYRDVRPIWEVFLQAFFYISPIFFPITLAKLVSYHVPLLHVQASRLMMASPFAAILQQARHALIDPSHPSAAKAIGGYPELLIPIAIGMVIIVWGYRVFSREAPRVAERL